MPTKCDVPGCDNEFDKRLSIVSYYGYFDRISEDTKVNLCAPHITIFEGVASKRVKSIVKNILSDISTEGGR